MVGQCGYAIEAARDIRVERSQSTRYISRFEPVDQHQSSITMAAHLIVASLVALVCITQSGLARPEQASTPNIQDLIKEVQTSIDKSLAEAKKSLNLPNDPNGEAIVKAIKEQTHKAEVAIKDMRNKIEQQLKSNPQLQEVVKSIQSTIDEAQAKLKKENPEVAANAQKGIDQMKSAYDSVTKEIEKINAEVNKKGGVRDDLDTLLKNLIDRGAAAAKELQVKVKEAVDQASKKN